MAVEQFVVKLKIQTSKVNPDDTSPDSYEAQLQAACDAQTALGNRRLAHIIQNNVSAAYTELVLIFEEVS